MNNYEDFLHNYANDNENEQLYATLNDAQEKALEEENEITSKPSPEAGSGGATRTGRPEKLYESPDIPIFEDDDDDDYYDDFTTDYNWNNYEGAQEEFYDALSFNFVTH